MFESIIQGLTVNTEIAVLTAFLLGVLTSISPCPLATNIAATAYILRNIKNPCSAVLNSIFYTLGRIFTYFVLGVGIILIGVNIIDLSLTAQSIHGEILGIILIIAGVIMLEIIKLNFSFGGGSITEKLSKKASKFGLIGAFFMGILFALAFCPYSAILFFGTLIPLGLASREGIILPMFYGLGTGIPVLVFAILFYFSAEKINKRMSDVSRFEKILRKFIGVVFIAIGVYMIFM